MPSQPVAHNSDAGSPDQHCKSDPAGSDVHALSCGEKEQTTAGCCRSNTGTLHSADSGAHRHGGWGHSLAVVCEPMETGRGLHPQGGSQFDELARIRFANEETIDDAEVGVAFGFDEQEARRRRGGGGCRRKIRDAEVAVVDFGIAHQAIVEFGYLIAGVHHGDLGPVEHPRQVAETARERQVDRAGVNLEKRFGPLPRKGC